MKNLFLARRGGPEDLDPSGDRGKKTVGRDVRQKQGLAFSVSFDHGYIRQLGKDLVGQPLEKSDVPDCFDFVHIIICSIFPCDTDNLT